MPHGMSHTPPPRPPRVPPFTPVPTRPRADGWTQLKQAEFIGILAQAGSVSEAAAFVGMARETAYRLRRKPGAESFCIAWDMALRVAGVRRAPPGTPAQWKVTPAEPWRAMIGTRWRVVMRNGRYCGSVLEAHNSAILAHLAQLDRAAAEGRAELRRALRSQPTQKPLCVPYGSDQ
jgi:hypothetical protein